MGLREERKTATVRALQGAATSLSRQRPWTEVTIDDIAEAAGVSRRTFFNYFASKEAVLAAVDADRTVEIIEQVRGRPASETVFQALRAGVVGTDRAVQPEVVRLLSELRRQPEILAHSLNARSEFEAALSEVVSVRQPEWSARQCALAVAIFFTVVRVSVTAWLVDPGAEPLIDAVDNALAQVHLDVR